MATADKSGLLYRFVEIDRSKIDRAKRLVPFSFSSEYPAVQRNDFETEITRAAGLAKGELYVEILDHDPDSVDLSMLKNRGAFLDEHDDKDQLGVIETADVENKVGRGVASLDSHQKAEDRLAQMERGSRPHISAGYKYTKFLRREDLPNGRAAIRFAWRALEVSSVAIPADPTIGIARAYQDLSPQPPTKIPDVDSDSVKESYDKASKSSPTAQRAKLTMPDIAPALPAIVLDENKIRTAALGEDRKRSKEIMSSLDAYVKDHGDKDEGKLAIKLRTLATECLFGENPVSVQEFQRRAMTEVIQAKPAKQTRMIDLGYDEKERNSYSFVRAIQNCILRGKTIPDPDTIEGDAHVKMARMDLGFSPGGFLTPADANLSPRSLSRNDRGRMQRDLNVTTFAQGGATVATELVLPIIELLRNMMVTDRLGCRTLSGLSGNVAIPRQTAAATAYSVSETAALTLSTQALDQILITPHRIGATNNYSKQLLIQSSMDVENFVRDDLLKVIALDWDRVTLAGQGAGNEPLGIINTPGIGSLLFSAAATYAKMVAMETAIAVLNAPADGRAYATTSATKGVLKSAAKLLVGATTVTAVAIWENNEVNGYPAIDSQQIPGNVVIFGSWPEVIKCLFGGFDTVLDPYTLATQAEVKITMNTWGDVVMRHPQSFIVSADAGNQ